MDRGGKALYDGLDDGFAPPQNKDDFFWMADLKLCRCSNINAFGGPMVVFPGQEGEHDKAQAHRLVQNVSRRSNPGDLIGAADEIRGLAIRDKQYSAAVGAIKEMGVLTGLRVDRTGGHA